MSSTDRNPATTETTLLPVYLASRMFLHQSASATYRQIKAGDLIARDVDGKLFIDALSMPDEAQARWKDWQLQNAIKARPPENDRRHDTAEQFSLLPEVQADRERAVRLGLSTSDTDEALRKLCAIKLLFNHDSVALGYPSKGALCEAIAKQLNMSPRNVQRLGWKWKQKEDLRDLVNKTPGPEPGVYTVLDLSARAQIKADWLRGLTKAQIYRRYEQYIKIKAESPGCRFSHHYHLADRTTVGRFIDSLSAIDDAAREGPEALKAACGHIDRSYLDLTSLERVESDECKLNLFSYDPRRPVNRRGEPWIRRYWLLTFYDARSMYPLVWNLCEGSEYELRHGIAVEDEINLFVGLVRVFGVPTAIHSDRGRFRGKVWGGEPYQQCIDKEFAPADGIFQRVGQLAGYPEGVRHGMPRVHNPRGARLERFHRWVADWFRGKPGWVGANTRERKMTRGDKDAEKHKLWCVGKVTPGEPSPLLTRDEVLAEVNKMMDAWREHNSEGTDMCGLTPRAVFVQCSPPSGFRRISEDELAFATAQHFENERIETGGIIELRDGSRYSHPLLIGLAGQKREVVRLRHDHSFITVLPAQKGEQTITAPRRARVGTKDPDELARQMELQNRVNKLAGEFTKAMEYDPGSQFMEAPKASQVIHPSEFMAAQEAPEPEPPDFPEISSTEWQSQGKGPRPKPWDFADLES
jgi:hypothetical protein